MDMHDIAVQIAGQQSRLKLRQGAITAVAADGTLSVTVAGSAVVLTGIKALASVCPVVGVAVWLATDGRDLFAIGTMSPPAYCSLLRTTDAATTTGVYLEVSFAAATRIDAAGMWAAGAPTKITCTVPGVYQLSGGVNWDASNDGRRDCRLLVNGTGVASSVVPAENVGVAQSVSLVTPLALGDYVELQIRQSSGGNLSAIAGALGPKLVACWIGRPVA